MQEHRRSMEGEMARWFAAGEDLDDFIFYWEELLREEPQQPAIPSEPEEQEK